MLDRTQSSMPYFLLCLYILQVIRFKPEIEYDLSGLSNTQSGHNTTAELFKCGTLKIINIKRHDVGP